MITVVLFLSWLVLAPHAGATRYNGFGSTIDGRSTSRKLKSITIHDVSDPHNAKKKPDHPTWPAVANQGYLKSPLWWIHPREVLSAAVLAKSSPLLKSPIAPYKKWKSLASAADSRSPTQHAIRGEEDAVVAAQWAVHFPVCALLPDLPQP